MPFLAFDGFSIAHFTQKAPYCLVLNSLWWRNSDSTAGRGGFGVDKCLSIAYNSWVTTAEVAEVKSSPSVRQLPQGERDFRRRICLLPIGRFLGPRRTCAELSSRCGVVLPGRTVLFLPVLAAQGFYWLGKPPAVPVEVPRKKALASSTERSELLTKALSN